MSTDPRIFWWEQTSFHWDIPFFSEFGMNAGDVDPKDRYEQMAAREQLWAEREELLDVEDVIMENI